MSTDPNERELRICADEEELATAVAELVVERAALAIERHGEFALALAGGTTPRRAYEILASDEYRDRIDWKKTHLFWGDERCVPATDPRSNERAAREALLDHVPVEPAQVHPIRCAGDPIRAAAEYERTLQEYFGGERFPLDLVLLGVGEDGHTASLFPGTGVLRETRWVAEINREEEEFARVTLTLPVINLARCVAFIVAGEGKAQIVHELFSRTDEDPALPASMVRPRGGRLLWLVDRAAASRLDRPG